MVYSFMEGAQRSWISLNLPRDGGYSDPLIFLHDDTCLLALIFPHILYYTQVEFLAWCHKKEALMALAITTLMCLRVAATSLGTSFLVILQQEMEIICSQFRATLEKTEPALLQKSLDSLIIATLQNRRNMELLFMKQWGIWRAVVEKCCFYANHSRIVRRILGEIRKDIDSFKSKTSYEAWFN